jgi:hypothetical protein
VGRSPHTPAGLRAPAPRAGSERLPDPALWLLLLCAVWLSPRALACVDDPAACLQEALLEPDPERGLSLLTALCPKHPPACDAALTLRCEAFPDDCARTCKQGDTATCLVLAKHLQEMEGILAAQPIFLAACEQNSATACEEAAVGAAHLSSPQTKSTQILAMRAFDLYAEACVGRREVRACEAAASLVERFGLSGGESENVKRVGCEVGAMFVCDGTR